MSPLWHRFAHHEAKPLAVENMHEAGRLFLGEHDWSAFSSAASDTDNKVRRVTDVSLKSVWDARARASKIEFRITATGFLRYMVRSIVGTLLDVGHGTKNGDTIQTAIVTGNRSLCGRTAPAQGLTLESVEYN
jgi:tRNA pseudouridine38-40 synthase